MVTNFILVNSWMNLLVAGWVLFICLLWSDSLDDRKGGIKILFGSEYFPNSGWRSKTVSWFGNLVFLLCLFAVVYRVAFIRSEEVNRRGGTYPVVSVSQQTESVICGGRNRCTQILYRAVTEVGVRYVPAKRVMYGNGCELIDYNKHTVLRDTLHGEIVDTWNYKNEPWLVFSKDCLR